MSDASDVPSEESALEMMLTRPSRFGAETGPSPLGEFYPASALSALRVSCLGSCAVRLTGGCTLALPLTTLSAAGSRFSGRVMSSATPSSPLQRCLCTRRAQGQETVDFIAHESVVLCIGAGGLGCELQVC